VKTKAPSYKIGFIALTLTSSKVCYGCYLCQIVALAVKRVKHYPEQYDKAISKLTS